MPHPPSPWQRGLPQSSDDFARCIWKWFECGCRGYGDTENHTTLQCYFLYGVCMCVCVCVCQRGFKVASPSEDIYRHRVQQIWVTVFPCHSFFGTKWLIGQGVPQGWRTMQRQINIGRGFKGKKEVHKLLCVFWVSFLFLSLSFPYCFTWGEYRKLSFESFSNHRAVYNAPACCSWCVVPTAQDNNQGIFCFVLLATTLKTRQNAVVRVPLHWWPPSWHVVCPNLDDGFFRIWVITEMRKLYKRG